MNKVKSIYRKNPEQAASDHGLLADIYDVYSGGKILYRDQLSDYGRTVSGIWTYGSGMYAVYDHRRN